MKKAIHFIITLFLLTSCYENVIDEYSNGEGFDVPKTESTDEYEVTYKYKPDVIVYNEATSDFIEYVVADTVLYISPKMPKDFMPEVDDVLSSRVYEKLPYGLGNRVLSIEEVDGLYECVTTPAALDEIFEELDITASISLLNDIEDGFYDDEGKFWEVVEEDAETRASFGSAKIITINLGKDTNISTYKKAYVSGTLSLGAIATLDFSLWQNKADCALEILAGINGEVGIKDPTELLDKTIFKVPGLLQGILTIGPVVLRPYIDLSLKLKAGLEGSISTSFSKQFGIKTGIKNGAVFHKNTTSDLNADLLKNISINAKGDFNLEARVDFGTGLYTKNIALEIEPTLTTGFSTDFKLNNENLFRESPTLDFGISAGADVCFFAKFFGKSFLHLQENLVSINLFNHSWNLLPTLIDSTLDVKRRDYDGPLTFDATYQLESGLLCKFANIIPAFRVYRGSKEILYTVGGQAISGSGISVINFELENLEHDISYTGKPCIVIGLESFDENGIPFTATPPAVAITDIVQTGSAEGEFYHNDKQYKYEFYFYMNSEIRGSENCSEWGIYAPSSNKIYNPLELKDGRVTEYWTGWSNNESATFRYTPYVILKGSSDYKLYDEHVHTLYYGFGTRSTPSIPMSEDIVMRLDSVKFERY